MQKLFAVAGLMFLLANPVAASINASETPGHTGTKAAKLSCEKNIIFHSALKIEIEVSCGSKSMIVVYSPIEDLFCDPKFYCRKNLRTITKNWFVNGYAEVK